MSLGLHPHCLAQLRVSLAQKLCAVSVEKGIFLSEDTHSHLFELEATLPQSGSSRKILQHFIGETPLVDFVYGTLARELCEGCDYDKKAGLVPLNSIRQFSDLESLAFRLVDQFESLPWHYLFTVALPAKFNEVFSAHHMSEELSPTAAIRSGTSLLEEPLSLISGIEKRDEAIAGGDLLIPIQPAWKPDNAYYQLKVNGFIGQFTETEPLREAVNAVRSFCGLAIAVRLLKPPTNHQLSPQREIAYLHRLVDGNWTIEDIHKLEPRHSAALHTLMFHDLDGVLDNDAKKADWMLRQLRRIGAVLRAGDRSKHVTLGSQWLFDSYCGSDELLQFVQAAVVVEILLGDKAASDQTGLGELLANRCAFLIASTHSERNEILKDFRDIYEVRSRIVHRGKSRLDLTERVLFNKRRWMCHRIIQQEISLLEQDGISETDDHA